MDKKKSYIITISLIAIATVFFFILSQTFPAEEQIFITDNYFITPKTQPILFVFMWFVNILLILFALWLGKLIASFLWTKGLLIQIVGGFLVIGAGILAYVWLVLEEDVNTITDMIAVSVIILFIGGLGSFMLFSSLLNKVKKKWINR